MQSFDVVSMNKLLNKQASFQLFEIRLKRHVISL